VTKRFLIYNVLTIIEEELIIIMSKGKYSILADMI